MNISKAQRKERELAIRGLETEPSETDRLIPNSSGDIQQPVGGKYDAIDT